MGTETRPSVRKPSARSIALAVLVESVQSADPIDGLLERACAPISHDPRERALAVELVYGVLRHQGTIDWRLQPVLDKPMRKLPRLIQMLLRMAAHQLLSLDRIPHSAAVNESVQLAKINVPVLGRDWSGFVNAVLRALLRNPEPSWPSAKDDSIRSLSVRYSVPEWLTCRWVDRLGADEAEAACAHSVTVPPVTLRVNRLKATRDDFLERLRQSGISASPTRVSPVGITIEPRGPITSLPGFSEGCFYVEDEAAQLIPPLLGVNSGEAILDACAAPGGKATHIAELIGDRGTILAVDKKGARLDLVAANCTRLGLRSVVAITGDARYRDEWQRTATHSHDPSEVRKTLVDRVLVDAPCSGLGVLRRHPEAKWRKDGAALARHQKLQLEILDALSASLRPGGVLVYSTCSVEPEETHAVIERFLNAHADFRRESLAPWLPNEAQNLLTGHGDLTTENNRYGMDVFYASRLRKRDS
ncbi:Ribosomal RNA small subunit methyltransferase B [Nitrospira japonica]|uniref:16S rRNA (cytosine(967)-C(5))-methyltransferase n=1 Tax=Nitrospira japonica TaxID=1325564 RepID=A0A1W1I3U4_9BACT|nr:16S rRNA (cytosine(967)-C(5))-methyltransferase RsmB [Nitrospira japonica]SLM47621.1 Ribosomal RNA small subunit methyltransferase B [Nitrospira japonica]